MSNKKRTNGNPEKQEEEFINYLLSGLSQRQAYMKTFPVSKKWKPNTTDTKASLLFKKVRNRYEELLEESKKEIDREAIMNANARREWLTKVINGEIKETILVGNEEVPSRTASLNDKMKAMDILNKMDGEYVTNINGNLSIAKKLEDVL